MTICLTAAYVQKYETFVNGHQSWSSFVAKSAILDQPHWLPEDCFEKDMKKLVTKTKAIKLAPQKIPNDRE